MRMKKAKKDPEMIKSDEDGRSYSRVGRIVTKKRDYSAHPG
jgi:hypothetical protein